MLQKLIENFHLKVFLSLKKDQRNYVYAATDRFDASTELTSAEVFEEKFKLIYNGDTTTSVYQPVIYRQKNENYAGIRFTL